MCDVTVLPNAQCQKYYDSDSSLYYKVAKTEHPLSLITHNSPTCFTLHLTADTL